MNKTKRKAKGKLLWVICGTFIFSVIGIRAANASILDDIYSIGKVYDEFTHELKSIENYVNNTFSNELKILGDSLGSDVKSAVNETIGKLGIPDVTEARKEVEKISSNSDNIVYTGEQSANEVDRQISRTFADESLNQNGQKLEDQSIKSTQDTIEKTTTDASNAQNRTSTQSVIKDLAKQNDKIEQTIGAMRNDGLKLKQTEDLELVNLTNISRSLDDQNQSDRETTMNEGFYNLEVTSRSRLF